MAHLHYPGTPGIALYGGRPKEAPPGPEGVDTSVTITNTGAAALASAPATFGFSFPSGAFQLAENDLRASVGGTEIPAQTDCIASHKDGSVRFAVVSLDAGAMTAGEVREVRLFTGNKRPAHAASLSVPSFDLVAEATIFGVQTTEVRIGAASTYALGQTIAFSFVANGVTSEYTVTPDASLGGINSSTGLFEFDQWRLINFVGATVTAGGVYRARSEWSNDLLVIEPITDDFGPFTVTVTRSNGAATTQNTTRNYAAPVLWTATMQAELAAQVASSNAGTLEQHKRRLHGSVVSEFRQMIKFKNASNAEHDFLTAIFDVRAYANGHKWVDLAMENTGMNAPNPRTLHYKLALKAAGTTVFSQPRFGHYPRARWHKQLWLGATAPQVRVTRDMAYFMGTGATPPMRTTHTIPDPEIQAFTAAASAKAASQGHRGPMAMLNLRDGMGDTGGRPDIGLVSGFDTNYLLSQDARAHTTMLQAASEMGVFPAHFRDEATGWPVGLDFTPNAEVHGVNMNVPAYSDIISPAQNKSHQPSAHYIPYLITGDAYYLDELMFWASWNLAMDNRAYRPAVGVGRLLIAGHGLRQTAWPLRTVMQAAIALPDWHPRKNYYRNQMDANLTFMQSQMGVSWFKGFANAEISSEGKYDCWHVDYMMSVFAWMLQNGENTKPMLDAIAEFHFGQVLHPEDGYCPQWVTKYYAPLGEANSWGQAARNVGGASFGQPCDWGGSSAGGDYAASYRGAVTLCANLGVLFSAAAYDVFKTITPALDVPENNERRKWAFSRKA